MTCAEKVKFTAKFPFSNKWYQSPHMHVNFCKDTSSEFNTEPQKTEKHVIPTMPNFQTVSS